MDENTVIKANTIYVSSNNEDQRNTSSFTFYPNRGFLPNSMDTPRKLDA